MHVQHQQPQRPDAKLAAGCRMPGRHDTRVGAVNSTVVAVVVNGSVITMPLVGLLDPDFTGNVTHHDQPVLAPALSIRSTNLGDLAAPVFAPQASSAGRGRRLQSAGTGPSAAQPRSEGGGGVHDTLRSTGRCHQSTATTPEPLQPAPLAGVGASAAGLHVPAHQHG